MVNSSAMKAIRNRMHQRSAGQSDPGSLRKLRAWAAAWGFALGLLVSGCAPSVPVGTALPGQELQPTPTPAPLPTLTSQPTEPPHRLISIWLDWEPHELQGLYDVIERYQDTNPEIEFAITYRPRNILLESFVSLAAQGDGPSILLGPASWGPSLRDQGLVLNLSPLLDPGMESEVHPIAWTQAAEGTQLFGLPLELQGTVLYRNRSLIAQPVGEVGAWLEAANLLKQGNRLALLPNLTLENALPMMAACGEEAFDARGELRLFENGGECWLGLLRVIGELGPVSFTGGDDLDRFKSGQAAWLIASTELREELGQAIGITNLQVDPWPLYEATGFPLRGYTWTENIYLVAGSTESDLESSWKFVQFLFGNEGQAILGDPEGAAHIPTTSAHEPPDSLMLAASSMLRAGIALPLHGELELVREPLTAAIQAVVLQGADPGFALKLAEERYQLLRLSSSVP